MKKLICFIIIVIGTALPALSWSCTGITLNTINNEFVSARTVEFDNDSEAQLIVVPRHYSYQGNTSEHKQNGISWKTKYAYEGFNFYHQNYVLDGVNEKGLYAGLFLFLKTEYQKLTTQNRNRSLACWQLVSYILSNYSDIQDVKSNLPNVVVLPVKFREFDPFPPFHFKVTDKSGKSIVIEYIKGKLHIFDDLYGVITNAPRFDWQTTNLSNYPNLSNNSQLKIKLPHRTISTFGAGYGLQGLPGDYSSPSRFVRAVFFTQYAKQEKNVNDTVMNAFHILNAFDIPYGTVKEPHIVGQKGYEYTVLTDVVDQKNLSFYFKTYDNQDIKMLSLKDEDLNANQIKVINLEGKTSVHKLSTEGVT